MASKKVCSLAAMSLTLSFHALPAICDPAKSTETPASGPAPLVVLFASGSSSLGPAATQILDQASRAYNQGRPVVMILTGSTDRVGSPQRNLSLSQKRANAVLQGLLDRGIPAYRFQVLAKGESEPPVPTAQGAPESRNRSVAISWR